jgi:hypothetical protein
LRVAVIVVTMLAVTTPSEASQSCMSKGEARQHFGSLHIYWHGADHCWDATPSRHRQIQARKKPLIQEDQRKVEPKWLDSMSAMLPDDEPVLSLRTPKSQDIERHERDDVVTDTSWADRWVDIGPAQSALVARRVRTVQISPLPVTEYKSELMISPHDVVVLAFIAFVLTLGTVGVLYRNDP